MIIDIPGNNSDCYHSWVTKAHTDDIGAEWDTCYSCGGLRISFNDYRVKVQEKIKDLDDRLQTIELLSSEVQTHEDRLSSIESRVTALEELSVWGDKDVGMRV
jgi:hypothetical protein